MNPMFFALYCVSWFSLYCSMFSPFMIICPFVVVSSPPSRFSSVLFPAPDGPSITTNSPLFIVRFMLFSAFIVWFPFLYSLVTFFSVIIGFMFFLSFLYKIIFLGLPK